MKRDIHLIDVEPVGTRTFRALVRRSSGPCAMEDVTEPKYPASPRGELLRRQRVDAGVSLGALARALGITAADLSGLEHGRKDLRFIEDWGRVVGALRELEPREADGDCPTCGSECHCGEDDPGAGQCPGCGGNCRTACR